MGAFSQSLSHSGNLGKSCLTFFLSVTPYGVVKDQKYDRAHRCHHYAVQIQPGDTDVAEHMEDPSAYDRTHHA